MVVSSPRAHAEVRPAEAMSQDRHLVSSGTSAPRGQLTQTTGTPAALVPTHMARAVPAEDRISPLRARVRTPAVQAIALVRAIRALLIRRAGASTLSLPRAETASRAPTLAAEAMMASAGRTGTALMTTA